MPMTLVWILVVLVIKVVRVFSTKARSAKSKTLCAGCQHAHVQFTANARRAISCSYGRNLRMIKIDVLYCTDYQLRSLPDPVRRIGFELQKTGIE